jgi:hypothetical protein
MMNTRHEDVLLRTCRRCGECGTKAKMMKMSKHTAEKYESVWNVDVTNDNDMAPKALCPCCYKSLLHLASGKVEKVGMRAKCHMQYNFNGNVSCATRNIACTEDDLCLLCKKFSTYNGCSMFEKNILESPEVAENAMLQLKIILCHPPRHHAQNVAKC